MSYKNWFGCALLLFSITAFGRELGAQLYSVQAPAKDKYERTRIADAGITIDSALSDSVLFLATEKQIAKLKKLGIPVEVNDLPAQALDFPNQDKAYHTYQQTLDDLDSLAKDYPNLVTKVSIGKSLQGRELAGVRLSSVSKTDSLPTAIFLGCHHAREHLSVEVPLMLAKYLAAHYATDDRIKGLLDTREVWFVPMVNPDGAEYDVTGGQYHMWRKNMRDNGGGSSGVDLNRNYGGFWGGPGASNDPDDDTYRGPAAWSEPETVEVRDFVRARKKTTVLLTFHTFSELVLWPWGHTYSNLPNTQDRTVFETMGKKMATWNHYKPEKGSDLYLVSGDTVDWAYDELKIFAFTFEMTPNSIFKGGFYPGPNVIQPTFNANLEPALYLIDKAANPYGVVSEEVVDPLHILN